MKRRAACRCDFALAFIALAFSAQPAFADEGGTSFWLPGQMGSLSAVPGDAGWSLPFVYYHTAVDAGGAQEFAVGGRIEVGLEARADLLIAAPGYVFSAPVAGGQASVGMTVLLGHMNVDVNATLTGPGGGVLSGALNDTVDGIGDLYPTAALKWNRGAHNYMAYAMLGVPVGAYDADRLANLGINHWSVDAGGGYTYLNPEKGHEFSAVLGFTHNFENSDTDYQNGLDGHLDWAASQFLSERLHLGVAGYFYEQLSGDSGTGATLGDFKSKVSAIGPQVGYFLDVGGQKWYANLKGFYEFDAENRPEGWNIWLAVAIPLGSGKT
ncbi:MAG: SphA family protein [Burkholderiales bacterium]